jgi:hypothetical protein
MPTVAATLKQINAIVDAFDNSIDQSDEMLIVGMTSRSLRNDLIRAYDVFNSHDFRQSSNIPTTAWAAASQTLWAYGTLAKNAALKISPEVSLKFGRLLEDLKAIVDS